MSLAIGEIKTERTGFKLGDRVLPWVSRCWLSAGFEGLRFDYGESESDAEMNLLKLLEAEKAQAPAVKCSVCNDSGEFVYGPGDRKIECDCVKKEASA